MLQTLIVFLIIFSVIVVIHEFGHFYWARKSGILVREFSVGMGPKLFSRQASDGTTYTVRMLPLGGYVRLAGLNEEEELKPGMTVGLVFDHNDQVSLINTSQQVQADELPVQVDAVDLAVDMMIEAIPVGQSDIVRYSVAPTANIIEADGTLIQVAPIETRYESASVPKKMLTNIAGPLNNFILSILTFMLVGLMSGVPSETSLLGTVQADSPAMAAGLQEGDRVTAIDDQPIDNWQALVGEIRNSPDQTRLFTVTRDGEQFKTEVHIEATENPNTQESMGLIGVNQGLEHGIPEAIRYGFTATWAVIAGVFGIFRQMFQSGFSLNYFGGPVAMAQMTNSVVDHGLVTILSFMAFLSANIGILNLLPIPALDGGKIFLNVIEGVRGKPLDQSKEGIITLIGAVLLIILMIAVTWNDIMRWLH